MFVYHFLYDLALFELADFDFYRDPLWTNLRALILTLFLTTVGISLELASRGGLDRYRYLRRLALLVASAGLVSLATYAFFGEHWVFFGVLHFIVVASLLGPAFLPLGRVNLLLGIALLLIASGLSHPVFDQQALRWIGLMTHPPATVDYVPLLPWFGLVLIGMGLARQVFAPDRAASWTRWHGQGRLGRGLRLAGRHSLALYLVHQPLFIALVWGYVQLTQGR
jgi:uncharacterized membrane protein